MADVQDDYPAHLQTYESFNKLVLFGILFVVLLLASMALGLVGNVPIFALLGLSIALTFKAEPLLRYTQAAADALNNPQQYVMAVLGTRAVPSPEARAALLEVQP